MGRIASGTPDPARRETAAASGLALVTPGLLARRYPTGEQEAGISDQRAGRLRASQ
jgi:hypothetical protein